eukprot:TRINITY_DN347_c0_g1_i1.p1 TRINITY_DN347_c0_g1~~TRINITY_DN347_c0_g1_i1.p1  ORF type:complete len:256 (-),score=44.20 TRINITY_DN347_c0_g1_i1:101-868(-)
MKLSIAVLVVLFAATVSGAALIKDVKVSKVGAESKIRTLNDLPAGKAIRAPQLDMCPFCVDFMNEAIDELLNAILNGGVVGGCEGLCAMVPNTILSMGCNLVCDYVGIDAFMEAINVTDPDPIYICQELDLCPIVNGGAVTINTASATPPKGPQGTTFDFQFVYTVTSPTGPGLVQVDVIPPDAFPFGEGEFEEGQPTGKYAVQFSLQAQPSEQEPFDAGEYYVQFAVCAGDCTTVHPYGGVYASVNTSFVITSQ